MSGPVEAANRAAGGGAVADLVAPGLRVLFCGINPGMRSAETGLHFARPGNRFWRVLQGAGFTERVLDPAEQLALLEAGIGITNLVARPSAAAAELGPEELAAGAARLEAVAAGARPAHVAVLGVGAYRTAFGRRRAAVGEQAERLGPARLWVLPNPSGLQASYQLDAMVACYGVLARAAGFGGPGAVSRGSPRAPARGRGPGAAG